MNLFSEEYDFFIVGASFGGSVLALELLKRGNKVLLIDCEEPGSRLKCAGGIEMGAFKSLGVEIPYQFCSKGILSLNGELYRKKIEYAVVDRRQLDRAVLQKAISLGAKFAKARYCGHDEIGRKVKILYEGKMLEVPYNKLVLAYGFKHTGKNLFFEPYSVAVVEIVKGESKYPDSLLFIFESGQMNGYYWIFPLPDGRLNIGAGSVTDFKNIKEKFIKFKEKYNLNGEVYASGAGIIPLYPMLFPQNGSVVRFGNSAGMVQPLTGEGLKYIVRNSQNLAGLLSEGNCVNLRWLMSESFFKILVGTTALRICYCFGGSGMNLYISLAKFATQITDWERFE